MIPVSLLCLSVRSALLSQNSSKTRLLTGKGYIKRGEKKTDKSEDIDAELLGDNSIESFAGSSAELEVAAERLFTSPPHPQPLSFEALSLRTPAHTVPHTRYGFIT